MKSSNYCIYGEWKQFLSLDDDDDALCSFIQWRLSASLQRIVIALINCLDRRKRAKESHQHKSGHQCKAALEWWKMRIEAEKWSVRAAAIVRAHSRCVHHDKAIWRWLMFYMITIIVVITIIDSFFFVSLPSFASIFNSILFSLNCTAAAFNTCIWFTWRFIYDLSIIFRNSESSNESYNIIVILS